MRNAIHESNASTKILVCFVVAVVLAVLSDITDRQPLAYLIAKSILQAMLIGSILLPSRQTLSFLLMISLVGPDIVQTTEQSAADMRLTASLWQGQFGPPSPGWVMIIYCSIVFLKTRVTQVDKAVATAALWFATVPFVTAYAYGSFQTAVAAVEVPTDAKLPLFLLVTIMLFRNWVRRDPGSLPEFASVFVGSVLARHVIDFAYALLGTGALFGDVVRVSVDSTKGTSVFMLLFGLALLLQHRRFVVGLALEMMSSLLIVVYATRGVWISAVLGVFVFARMLRTARFVLILPAIVVLAYLGVLALSILFPDNLDLATTRLNDKVLYATDSLLERHDPVRYAEIANAWDATVQRRAWLWGSGYGGYYTESVLTFPLEMRNAFPDYCMTSGQYYTLHHFVLRGLFEYGLIGFYLMARLWLVPGLRCFRVYRMRPLNFQSSVVMAMVAFLPTSMLELSWTIKGMIVAGFSIAFCASAVDWAARTGDTRRAPSRSRRKVTRYGSNRAARFRRVAGGALAGGTGRAGELKPS